MKLSFRQGIVRHQQDGLGTPTFLDVSGGYVSLIVSPDPTIVTFIHGQDKDYLYTELQSVSQAWGPFTPGMDQWLYWEINPVTGLRTFGSTNLEPIEQATMPTSPSVGQMWFNTTTNLWHEYNGFSWVEVIRVFACRLELGTTPRSMSINAPTFTGTQVGITGTRRVGALAYDSAGKPIRTGDKKFFTTEDVFVTGVPTGASIRVSNIVLPGVAQEPLAAYSVVQYYDFNKLEPASPYTQGLKLYGFIEEDAATGELINFVTEGMIVNDGWDWIALGADVNDPVYNDATGLISLTPAIPNQLPVGVVTGRNEILFSPRLFPQVNTTINVPVAFSELTDTPTDYTGSAGRYVQVNPTADGLEFSLIDTSVTWGEITGSIASQTDLQAALDGKSDTGHTHLEADITDLDKYTKADVDTKLSYKSDTGHTHLEADITDLDKYTKAEVDGFLGQKADLFHFHAISDVTNLQTELNNKVQNAVNVGGGPGWFRDKIGTDLNFKTLVAGSNITITPSADTIEIAAAGGGSGGLPTSALECNVLVSDAAGGWNERAPQELTHPYDVTLSLLNTVPDNTKVLKFVSPHKMKIPDYGHQGNCNRTGALPTLSNVYASGFEDLSTTFSISVNGTQKGQFGFHDGNVNGAFFSDIGAGWPNSLGNYLGSFLNVSVGDVIEIQSPNGVNVNFNEVATTLRAFIEPAAPCGPAPTVTFTKDASLNEAYEFGALPSWAITGAVTHAEWSVVGVSTTFPPSGPGDIKPLANYDTQGFCQIGFVNGGFHTFNYNSQYIVLSDPNDPFISINDFGSAYYWLLRLTVFGPGGIGTAVCWAQPLGG